MPPANSPFLGLFVAALVAADASLLSGPVSNANSPSHGFVVAALVAAAFRNGAVANANSPLHDHVIAALVVAAFFDDDGPVPNANPPNLGLFVAALVAADAPRHPGREAVLLEGMAAATGRWANYFLTCLFPCALTHESCR